MGEYMGTSLDLGVSGVHCTMRAIVFVLLGAVAINAEAEADPYLVHHFGVGHTVAGVYNAHVPGVYSHPYHLNVMYGKREAEAEADPLVYGVAHHVPGVHAGVTHVAGVHPVYSGVYSHPYHYNVMYGKHEAEPEAEADPLMYHHTGVAGVAGVHPVHTSVYNHHVVPAVHHGVNHVAGLYIAPVSTVTHFAGVHHAGVYNTYPYLG